MQGHAVIEELESKRPHPFPELTEEQCRAYPSSYTDACNAQTEEEVLAHAYTLLDFELALNRCWGVNIFIPDLLKTNQNLMMGSADKGGSARTAIMIIAEKIKKKYEEEGCLVDFTNGMGDFRDFYFDIAKK